MQQLETKSNVSPDQVLLIEALLSNRTTTEAAKFCGISRTTVWRWQADPDFQLALSSAQKQLLDEATSRLVALAESSINVVVSIRDNGSNQDAVRLRAALAILELSRQLQENILVGNQLSELLRLTEEN